VLIDRLESLIERLLFASRWLLVPLYVGLAAFLLLIAVQFFREILHVVATVAALGSTAIVLLALSLVDLVLVASLVVMVMLSGYENFVSKLDIAESQRNLAWLGKLDAGSLELKVAASIVAISSIHLLGAFMEAENVPNDKLMWLVIIHLTFVVSALLLTVMDRLIARQEH
jgi:uncharacterized protein (TIGR00645 family)